MVMTQFSLGDHYRIQKGRFTRFISLTFAVLFLNGCSTVGPDFTSMTEAYERAIDMHQRQSLLVNMMRASESLPLVFTDITTVSGTGSIAMSGSVNANIASGDPSSFNGFFSPTSGSSAGLSTGLATNRSFTFSLGSLNNEEFYRGFLAETSLDDIHFYMNSGVPAKEFIGSMLFESIQVTKSNGNTEVYLNEPLLPNYDRFKNKMYELLDAGLTIEMKSQATNVGPEITKDEFLKVFPLISSQLNAPKANVQAIKTKSGGYQIVKYSTSARVCFQTPLGAHLYGSHMVCEANKENVINNSTVSAEYKTPGNADKILIKVRSTNGVFSYLGKLIALQTGPKKEIATVRILTSDGNKSEQPILVVLKGNAYNKPLLTSVKYNGEMYSIPREQSGLSARVLQMLSIMVIMNKIPGSIPASQGVLIR